MPAFEVANGLRAESADIDATTAVTIESWSTAEKECPLEEQGDIPLVVDATTWSSPRPLALCLTLASRSLTSYLASASGPPAPCLASASGPPAPCLASEPEQLAPRLASTPQALALCLPPLARGTRSLPLYVTPVSGTSRVPRSATSSGWILPRGASHALAPALCNPGVGAYLPCPLKCHLVGMDPRGEMLIWNASYEPNVLIPSLVRPPANASVTAVPFLVVCLHRFAGSMSIGTSLFGKWRVTGTAHTNYEGARAPLSTTSLKRSRLESTEQPSKKHRTLSAERDRQSIREPEDERQPQTFKLRFNVRDTITKIFRATSFVTVETPTRADRYTLYCDPASQTWAPIPQGKTPVLASEEDRGRYRSEALKYGF
ncbi:hypothetical protein GGX14DRAFT_563823 [Mycena pura]|uniref:Uncharacterized protein n=1 Tax=Mycena pura TaxID=153505 RepID=A0AAD6VM13_9AGAR|nr:hypothetical protein GGX14DRAFT_563823 [Mycena pura]